MNLLVASALLARVSPGARGSRLVRSHAPAVRCSNRFCSQNETQDPLWRRFIFRSATRTNPTPRAFLLRPNRALHLLGLNLLASAQHAPKSSVARVESRRHRINLFSVSSSQSWWVDFLVCLFLSTAPDGRLSFASGHTCLVC